MRRGAFFPGGTQRVVLFAIAVAIGLSFVQVTFNFNLVIMDGDFSRGNIDLSLLPESLALNTTGSTEQTHESISSIQRATAPRSNPKLFTILSKDPPDKFLLSVPFYVYEDLVWEEATWNGSPLLELSNGRAPKHTDDYWFMKSALQHPMRTHNASEAKLFVIPILQNVFDSRASHKKKNLCFEGLCNGKLMNVAGETVNASIYYQQHPEAHIIVASHFAHHKTWWVGRIPPSLRAVLWNSNNIGFEDYKTNSPDRITFPKLHVGKACPLVTNKTQDVVMIATLKLDDARFRDRETICSWVFQNDTTRGSHPTRFQVETCGWGEMCPALANAKLGFHARGDTPSSSRLFDTILSGTVPIFTIRKQFEVVPDFIDWSKISYFIDLENITETEFVKQLQAILLDTESYDRKHKALLEHRHWFDWKGLYPFDLYMYQLQARLYPWTRHPTSFLGGDVVRLPPPPHT